MIGFFFFRLLLIVVNWVILYNNKLKSNYRVWFTFYKYRYNQITADNGWKILLLLGSTQAVHDLPSRTLTSRGDGSSASNNNNNDINNNDANSNVNVTSNETQASLAALRYYSNWTIKYQSTLGNETWVAKVLIISHTCFIVCIGVALCYVHYVLNDETRYEYVYSICLGFILIFTLSALFVLGFLTLWKVSRFTDVIYIKYELITGVAVGMLILIIPGIARFIININKEALNQIERKIFFFGFGVIAVTWVSVHLISVVLYRYNKRILFEHLPKNIQICCINFIEVICNFGEKTADIDLKRIGTGTDTVTLSRTKSRSKPNKGTLNYKGNHYGSKGNLDLNTVISHEMGFRLFMRHLVNEYAIENLLFCTEVIQFKKNTLLFAKYNKQNSKLRHVEIDNSRKSKKKLSRQSGAATIKTGHLSVKPLNMIDVPSVTDSQTERSTTQTIPAGDDTNIINGGFFGPASPIQPESPMADSKNFDDRKSNIDGVGTNNNGNGSQLFLVNLAQNDQNQNQNQGTDDDGDDHDSTIPKLSMVSEVNLSNISINSVTSVGDVIAASMASLSNVNYNGNIGIGNIGNGIASDFFPDIPSHIPRSNIFQAKNIFKKIEMIMQRYVNDSAHLQVNISSLNRYSLFGKIKDYFQLQKEMGLITNDDVNENSNDKYNSNNYDNTKYDKFEKDLLNGKNDPLLYELYSLFDDSCREILSLLRASFRAFTKTDAFQTFDREFNSTEMPMLVLGNN